MMDFLVSRSRSWKTGMRGVSSSSLTSSLKGCFLTLFLVPGLSALALALAACQWLGD